MILRISSRILVIFFILGLFTDEIHAGIHNILFSYPRNGNFKFLESSNDPWYSANHDYWASEIPDKWQHFMLNYGTASLFRKKLSGLSIVAILSTANTLKEIEDGYREGASVRDLAIGSLGMFAGLYVRNMVCTYDSERIDLRYYISF